MTTTETSDGPDGPAVRRVAADLDGLTRHVLEEIGATGTAHTGRLTEATGQRRQRIHERLDDLEEFGLVQTEVRTPDAGGQPQRHAALTERGRRFVAAGLVEAINETNSHVVALRDRVETVEQRLDETLDEVDAAARESTDEELAEVWAVVGDLEDRLTDARDRLAEQADARDVRLNEHAERLNAHEKKTAELGERVDSLADRADKLAAAVERIDGQTATVERLSGQVDGLRGDLDDLVDEVEEIRYGTLAPWGEQIKANKQQSGENKQTLRDLRKRVRKLEESDSGGFF